MTKSLGIVSFFGLSNLSLVDVMTRNRKKTYKIKLPFLLIQTDSFLIVVDLKINLREGDRDTSQEKEKERDSIRFETPLRIIRIKFE